MLTLMVYIVWLAVSRPPLGFFLLPVDGLAPRPIIRGELPPGGVLEESCSATTTPTPYQVGRNKCEYERMSNNDNMIRVRLKSVCWARVK